MLLGVTTSAAVNAAPPAEKKLHNSCAAASSISSHPYSRGNTDKHKQYEENGLLRGEFEKCCNLITRSNASWGLMQTKAKVGKVRTICRII